MGDRWSLKKRVQILGLPWILLGNSVFVLLMKAQITRKKINLPNRRVAEIQIFEKTYLIVIKDETGLKFKMNDSTLFLIGSYAQKLVASY